MANEPRSQQVFFNPDDHPEDTLKAFEEFTKIFNLRYDAQYPDPPKVSLEAAIERWIVTNATEAKPKPKPNLEQYDKICSDWKQKDKVAKLLGMFSSHKLYEDWCVAQPDENERPKAKWPEFVRIMKEYYKPTENETLKHYTFRSIFQQPDETFPRFCNRVDAEARHCNFKCPSVNCTAESVAIRDQIIIGTNDNSIREEALKQSWDLKDLRQEGMRMESAARGGAQISNEGSSNVNKIGKYSFSNIKSSQSQAPVKKKQSITCHNCGSKVSGSIYKHKEKCPAKSHKCNNCQKNGHFDKVCRSQPVKQIDSEEAEAEQCNEEDMYNINLFRIKASKGSAKPQLKSVKSDFTAQVVINNRLDRVVADTGARISVCGTAQARKWGILDRLTPSKVKIKPYESDPIQVYGEARCSVTFGLTSIPVVWHVISGNSEAILSGNAALQLGIVQFNGTADTFQPVLMIDAENKENLQAILSKYPENFSGLGKLKDYHVKLHVKEGVKPVNVPATTFPYHLQQRAQAAIDDMIKHDVIEEHPPNQPAPWISNAVLSPKDDESVRVTMDARNVNKAIQSSNYPIPKQEDIKAKLSGAKVFSKMDLKSAFWQIELAEESRHLTVFHANDKLYRYKRLTMGLSPAQAELNAALRPVFSHIDSAHVIHDDLIVAANNDEEHDHAIQQCMEAASKAGLTFNPSKCFFGRSEISFWGMIFSSEGVRPDPAKVEALEYITPPNSKEELISFLCMMQSNSDFIASFSRRSSTLRELTKGNVHFKWEDKHQKCFEDLIKSFKKDTLLRYFDMSKPVYIFTDAHISGLGAMLAQGDSITTAKPVAFASRTTSSAEQNYPQMDLEAMGLDFGLRRFRKYLVGAPDPISVVTDHKPLCPIFNGRSKGSIRTEKIKMRHQDVQFNVIYQKGMLNQTDFLSRRGKPLHKIPVEEQNELNDLNNLLYMLHTTPIIDHISIAKLSSETAKDNTLKELIKIIERGQSWIPKSADTALKKFQQILPELTLTANKIVLKSERIILPNSLQDMAIELAHRGSHPGQSGIERRLRSHFFFHDMQKKVEAFVKTCNDCQSFSNKKTSEPQNPHKVPSKCWDTVAVDLFGPMPSKEHVVVVQDLASRFPAAKLISSTNAKQVLPALGEIYNNYGNPENQLSDNGPPFNSTEMKEFATKRDITLKNTPPHHPQSNPVETFMKPLGKAMKIATQNKVPKDIALAQLLQDYRDTPNPATHVSPGAMLFRDGYRTTFPRTHASEDKIEKAKARDQKLKLERSEKVNSSKYCKQSDIKVGETVILRDFNRKSKFDPIFPQVFHEIIDISRNNSVVTVRRKKDGRVLRRHPDDIKVSAAPPALPKKKQSHFSEQEQLSQFHRMFNSSRSEEDDFTLFTQNVNGRPNEDADDVVTRELRRSCREKKPNPRYINEDMVNG